MGPKARTVWVVMHYEFMGLPDSPHVDAMQFHVSSTLRKAEFYIRKIKVSSHSWWQVHPHVVDASSFDEGIEVHYFSYRGTRLKSAPFGTTLAAFHKHVARNPEMYLRNSRG